MAITANSYGTLAGVGVLVPKWSDDGAFANSTRPVFGTVENWINQISGLVNSMLAQAGFTVPITDTDVKDQMIFFVEQEVAAVVEGINGFGRFGPTSKTGGRKGRFALLVEDVQTFIEAHKAGMESLGADRATNEADAIGFLETDQSGDEVAPIFQREAFGNSFRDWDK